MKRVLTIVIYGVALLVTLVLPLTTQAAQKALPKLITMTAYNVGTTAHILASSCAQIIGKKAPFACRVEPGASDPARLIPLREGDTEIGLWTQATGMMASQARGSVFKPWGPQPIRLIFLGGVMFNSSPFVRASSNIYTLADAKGKRWPDIVGCDAQWFGELGLMAFGGYTEDDVVKISINGYTAHYRALLEGRTDIAFGAINSAAAQKQASTPDGIRWLKVDPNDKEGWMRIGKYAPWMVPMHGERGAGVTPENPIDGTGYPDTIFCYDHCDENIAYQIVKALHKGYDELKDMHKLLVDWTIDNALRIDLLEVYMIPYHPGAIKYFKEIGKWTPRHEAFQRRALVLDRQRMARRN